MVTNAASGSHVALSTSLTNRAVGHADDPKENIMCVLHECFDYIDEARTNGGKVYVHCSQGVSRSATIAIGYCIWKLNKDFDIIFEYVKKIRTVVSPNMGFQCVSPLLLMAGGLWFVVAAVMTHERGHCCCIPGPFSMIKLTKSPVLLHICRLALLQWQKRRKFGVKRCYISRLAPQSESVPLFVVPKSAADHSWVALDSRGVFIIEISGAQMSYCILSCFYRAES